MLTESQKEQLTNKIYRLMKEAMMESEKEQDSNISNKNDTVMKWLNSAQNLHSVLAYRLWPNVDKDAARSLFSKKYRGEDSDGKKYSFSGDEINSLYNMCNSYINKLQ